MKHVEPSALSDRELERRIREMDGEVQAAYERAEARERQYQELLSERQRRLCAARGGAGAP